MYGYKMSRTGAIFGRVLSLLKWHINNQRLFDIVFSSVLKLRSFTRRNRFIMHQSMSDDELHVRYEYSCFEGIKQNKSIFCMPLSHHGLSETEGALLEASDYH